MLLVLDICHFVPQTLEGYRIPRIGLIFLHHLLLQDVDNIPRVSFEKIDRSCPSGQIILVPFINCLTHKNVLDPLNV